MKPREDSLTALDKESCCGNWSGHGMGTRKRMAEESKEESLLSYYFLCSLQIDDRHFANRSGLSLKLGSSLNKQHSQRLIY